MTSSVTVSAVGEPVQVLMFDRHPDCGWIESATEVVPAGDERVYYVWCNRRVLVTELETDTCPPTT